MTDEKRRDEIHRIIREYTAAHTGSRAAARSALINEGIYTKRGKLRVEFGGASKKAKAAV